MSATYGGGTYGGATYGGTPTLGAVIPLASVLAGGTALRTVLRALHETR